MAQPPVLVVGNAVLDLVLEVDHYPAEDEEMRATSRRLVAGGNAANTARVLACLGHPATLLATLAPDAEADTLARLLARDDVDTSRLVRLADGRTPLSYILLNTASGSRTIVHHRELSELRLAHFAALPLANYAWVHFEGRNVAETGRMLAHLRGSGYAGRVSVEIEKNRLGIESLMGQADLLMFSRDWAEAHGHSDAPSLLRAMGDTAHRRDMTCTWGSAGAWARDTNGRLHHVAACVPPRVVDTVGAGDAFNAGLIAALLAGADLADALAQAVQLAGRKVGGQGLEPLRGVTDKPG